MLLSFSIAAIVILLVIVKLQETTLAANQPLGGRRSNGKNKNSWTETEKFEEPENQLDQPEFYSDDQQANQNKETVSYKKPEREKFDERVGQMDQQVKIIVAPQISLEPLQIRTFIATVSWY